MRVRLTLETNGALCMESPYEAQFVQAFKLSIPWDGRQWNGERKRWLVSALYATELLVFLKDYGADIQDDRMPAMTMNTPLAVPPMPEDLRLAFDALYLQYHAPLCVAEGAYKNLVRYFHPDKGGDVELFHSVNDAIEVVRRYLDPRPVQHFDGTDDSLPF